MNGPRHDRLALSDFGKRETTLTRDLSYELSELDLASLDGLSLDHQTCDKTPTTALAIAEAPPLWPVSAYRGLDTAIAGEARAAALRINARTRANTIEPLSNPLRGLLRVSRFSIAAYKNVVTSGVIGPQKERPAMVDRRLAPILVADIIGFSHLVETDETFALEAVNSTRFEVVDPAVSQHR